MFSYEYRRILRREWDHLWLQVAQPNLVQSWEYGDAKGAVSGWEPVRYLFEDRNGEPHALMQALVKPIPYVGGIVRINRGPLLLGHQDAECDCQRKLYALQTLMKLSRDCRWWVCSLSPEIDEKESCILRLNQFGLLRNRKISWGSAIINLEESEEDLMKSLKSKWRNLLKKSLKSEVNFTKFGTSPNNMTIISNFYSEAKQNKKFKGLDDNLLLALSKQNGKHWEFSIYVAQKTKLDSPMGVVVSIIHGRTATYLVGNTNTQGRKNNVNYGLLWQAILDAKKNGCKYFDLGGLNERTPQGIAHFKSGLHADRYSLAKEIICFPMFNM